MVLFFLNNLRFVQWICSINYVSGHFAYIFVTSFCLSEVLLSHFFRLSLFIPHIHLSGYVDSPRPILFCPSVSVSLNDSLPV